MSGIQNGPELLRSKRQQHTIITLGQTQVRIRDQRPISEVVLGRSLTHEWNVGDFIEHLNSRVFFWPTEQRLSRHYTRYAEENPVILRVKTSDLLALNSAPLFCRLNSGATRCSSHWDGNAPERGPNTFLPSSDFEHNYISVAEVTFEDYCRLPKEIWTGHTPAGPWRRVQIT